MEYRIREIRAKSILQKSGIPGVDWVVNPYTGCRFGCKYCYATFAGRWSHPNEEWGTYVDVKVNAPELLRRELEKKLSGKARKNLGSIFFSSVTDPYQGIEAKYQLTRMCLKILADIGYEGPISILTKSSLVIRDIDIFKRLKDIEVGLTVTSTGDPIAKYLETYATPNEDRIKTLKKLHREGIKTYAFVGPLLPHFVWMKDKLEQLLQQLKETGVEYIYLEHLNLRPYIRDRLFTYLAKDHPQELKKFKEVSTSQYQTELDRMLQDLTRKIGLRIVNGQPIHHDSNKSWQEVKHE